MADTSSQTGQSDHKEPARYDAWLEREAGEVAISRCRDMLKDLLSGWPRRSRSMLVLYSGKGFFLETLWEAGFDVTGQDNDPACLETARERLGKRVEFVLSSPEHMPFDDCAFDYAVVGLTDDFRRNQEAVLREIRRLVCCGVIFIFPSSWSLFSLECRLRKDFCLCSAARPLLQSPRELARGIRRVCGKQKTAWSSILPATTHTWKTQGIALHLNKMRLPLPLGALAGLRVDFGSLYTSTPLLLHSSNPVTAK